MSTGYLPLVVPRTRTVLPISLNREAKQWASVKNLSSHTFQEAVTDVAFKLVEPNDLAVSHGLSISLIAQQGGRIRKNFSRFRDLTYSPHFKHDGLLLVAGSGDGVCKVFDVSSRTALRTLSGHKGAVRTTRFSRDGLHIVSGSDDSTVRVWDLATSTCLFSLTDATDYVRAQNSSPASRQVWATGSSDGKARLYDLRSKQCIFTLDHASQVDDVHILPGGSRAVTVGGPDVRVWDFFAGGKIVANMACHAKAVTSAAVDSDASRLVTAGLDGYVKIHDLSSFQTKGILSFGSQITSVDIASEGRRFAVGMADGAVEVRAVRNVARSATADSTKALEQPEREFEGWGRGFDKGDERVGPRPGTRPYFERGPTVPARSFDVVVGRPARSKLADYELELKAFNHKRALDKAVATSRPDVVVAVVDELMNRRTLESALDGRPLREVCPLLKIIQRHIANPHFGKKFMLLLDTILDVYGSEFGRDVDADRLLAGIMKVVQAEVKICKELTALQGGVDVMMWAPRAAAVTR